MSLHATFHLLIGIYRLFCVFGALSALLRYLRLHSERSVDNGEPEKKANASLEIRFLIVKYEWMCVTPMREKKSNMKWRGVKVHLHLRNYQINYARNSCDLLPFPFSLSLNKNGLHCERHWPGIGAYMYVETRKFFCLRMFFLAAHEHEENKKKNDMWWMRYEREPTIGVSVNWR